MRVVSYDQQSGELVVDLPSFYRYVLFDVPVAIYLRLVNSVSKQEHFNEHLWGSKYEHCTHWPDLDSLLKYFEDYMEWDSPVSAHSIRADDDTPLHVACLWGDICAVDLLVSAGADVNARGDMGCSPLYVAVRFGHFRTVERLLRAGADPDDRNEFGSTAREEAMGSSNPEIRALFQ
ncbi:MAG: ankyrin repeat domain-containing protein [Gammaproteobacteria bacterium]